MLERPATELERRGRKRLIACDAFCTSVNLSTRPLTAGPKRPVGESGALRKTDRSDSPISASVSHRWRSVTVSEAIERPIACAATLVARRERSVALRRSVKVVWSGPFSSSWRRRSA